MKFEKYFDKKLNRWQWRFDFTLNGQRIRRGGFDLKSRAESAVAAIRLKSLEAQYGLPSAPAGYTLGNLLAERENSLTDAVRRQSLETFTSFVELTGENVALVNLTSRHIRQSNLHRPHICRIQQSRRLFSGLRLASA